MYITGKPEPFVKWAGGKRQLLKALLNHVPIEYNAYIEPFVGGGALLFALLPEKGIINDINSELINAYRIIKHNIDELIDNLKKHKNEKKYYYRIRELNPECLSPVERASRFIYLNKTCYNGLYRENSKGKFNVPFGKYKHPFTVDERNLRAVSHYLNVANIEIYNQDYRKICKMAKKQDFVYLDPPYFPVKKASSFTKYHRYDFTEKDHIELYETFKELDKRGCYAMLSNSNTDFIRDLYKDYNIIEIQASRFINSKTSERKHKVLELLIKNY